MMDLDDWDDIAEPDHMPPGDEAFLQIHAGREAILHAILIGMTPRFGLSTQLSIHAQHKFLERGKLEIYGHARIVHNSVLTLGEGNFLFLQMHIYCGSMKDHHTMMEATTWMLALGLVHGRY
jgi:hypothetical protein